MKESFLKYQSKNCKADVNPNYDVVIIGSGVSGCCVARELGRFDCRVLVLEASLDIADVTTRANSGIVHAGFDPIPGTLKAKYNVAGCNMYPQLAKELGFMYQNNGAFVVAFSDEEMESVRSLYERGLENGVKGMKLLTGDEAREIEPNLSSEAVGCLHATTSGICDPYQVAYQMAINATNNGVEFKFNSPVVGIEKSSNQADPECSGFDVKCQSGDVYHACFVVNAAGLFSDEINNMVSAKHYRVVPKRGDYCLFDDTYGKYFGNTIFQVPSAAGKGVLVSPTVHGNLFIGPSSDPQEDKGDYSTGRSSLNYIHDLAIKSWPELNMSGQITNFAGLRATVEGDDFIIGQPDDAPGFWNLVGIDSPGLTSAPAIGVDVSKQIAEVGQFNEDENFCSKNDYIKRFHTMTDEQRSAQVAKDPSFGHVICRCREVTEGEISEALRGPIPVLCVDSLKWRCGATMGRCHGGFCTPEIIKMMAAAYDVTPDHIMKRCNDSWMISHARPDYLDCLKAEMDSESIVEQASTKEADDVVFDAVVVGGGAAGIAATIKLVQNKVKKIVLIDREARLGGILKQCIHSGFGLHYFGRELTGPEYAQTEIENLFAEFDDVQKTNVGYVLTNADTRLEVLVKTTATSIRKNDNFDVFISGKAGYSKLHTISVVLSAGSRERGFGTLNIAGSRPSGIYTAGCAQNFINLQGCIPGRDVVILGSGDIGLIMARRMVLSGMNVKAVYEVLPHPSGLQRNIVQCLDDFGIPLYLSHTVSSVSGKDRLESVTISEVDENLKPIEGTEETVECDTLLLSVGLIPECELAKNAGVDMVGPQEVKVDDKLMSSLEGLFVCGNALHIHGLVDEASKEGAKAGLAAAEYLEG